jgi:hypothetical protein
MPKCSKRSPHVNSSHHSKKESSKKMDVYLATSINEIQLLWNGIKMYDISQPPSNKAFFCYGILCWTIHDSLSNDVCLGNIFFPYI